MQYPQDAESVDDRLMAQRLLAAFEHLRESIVLTDPDDRFVLANRAFRDLNQNVAHAIQVGQKFEDYIRAGVAAGNYPDAVGREQEWLAARIEERRNPGHPVERQRRDGRWFLIDDRRLPDGSTIRFGTEITERKRAEARLNERNRDLQLVVDSVPVMITRLDREERFVFANRAYAEFMELAPEDIVGRRVAEVLAPDAYAQIRPALKRALSGDPASIERIQRRSNGEVTEIEGRYIPDVDVGGRVIGMFALHRDVTAERMARRLHAESEGKIAALLRNVPGDVYRCRNDPDWTMEFVSEGVFELTGYPPSAFTTERRVTFGSLVHPDDKQRIWQEAQEALAARRPYLVEYRIRDANGTEKWVWDRGFGEYADDGSVLAINGFVADISERKKAEQALHRSEARFRSLTALSSDWYWEQDAQFRYVYISEDADSRGAVDMQVRAGKTRWELPWTGVTEAQWAAHRAQLEAHEVFHDFEVGRPGAKGETVWVSVSGEPVFDAQGKFTGYRGVTRNITERKRNVQALATTEARFRAVFERSSAGMAITDENGTYLSVNAAFARFFGYPSEDIVGRMKVSDLRSADDAEGAELYRRLVAGEIGYFERDRPYRRKDGTQIWGRATASAVREPGGKATYVVAVFTDITEEVLARARIERMNAELEDRVETRTAELREAVKELDAFTYSVSHDLRAPIGAVSGFAHLLRNAEAESLSDDGLRLLGFIEHNAERMTRLIEGLLRFSRLGRSDLRRARVSMNGLAAESLLDFVDEAARAHITAGSMPECDGDPALLSQVWSNLLGNALKYSRGAEAPCIDIGWDAGRGAYFVRDNGAGFDMAYAGKLFGVFERLHAEAEFEGSGIGLAIAERIVRLHGGAIWADAAPGRGATFWFTVPEGGE